MPEKTIHGYNYKVRIWYPEAPEDKTEGTILAAYDEDLAKEIQTRYPGVTYEIISKEPVLGDPQQPKCPECGVPMTWKVNLFVCPRCQRHYDVSVLQKAGIRTIPPIEEPVLGDPGNPTNLKLIPISKHKLPTGWTGPEEYFMTDNYHSYYLNYVSAPLGKQDSWDAIVGIHGNRTPTVGNPYIEISLSVINGVHKSKRTVGYSPIEANKIAIQFMQSISDNSSQFDPKSYGKNPGNPGNPPQVFTFGERIKVAIKEDPVVGWTHALNLWDSLTPSEKEELRMLWIYQGKEEFTRLQPNILYELFNVGEPLSDLAYLFQAIDKKILLGQSLSENPGNPGEKPSRLELIRRIKPILPSAQLNMSGDLLRGEEGEHFEKVFLKLAQTFEAMPQPYQTEGTPTNDKIIHLHYFTSGSDWYIIERDSGQEQIQAFGYVILNLDLQNAEWGYVNIEEIKGYPQVELDFYWTPKTFKEVMIEKNPRAIESDNLEPIPEYVKTDPNLLGNAIMHIVNAELTKIGVTSGGELRERGLFSEYESNFITALQKVGIPKPLSQQVEEILTSLNYHTANEILTRRGYYPWKGPQPITENEKIAQEHWDKLEIKKRRDYLMDYVERQIPGAQDYYSQSWWGLSQEIRNFILTAYKK